jgi:hypothetical protein
LLGLNSASVCLPLGWKVKAQSIDETLGPPPSGRRIDIAQEPIGGKEHFGIMADPGDLASLVDEGET